MVTRLVEMPGYSPGFRKLFACGRVDLTIESLVVSDRYAALFDVSVTRVATDRLANAARDLGGEKHPPSDGH
jgi:hypothetical protein